MKIIKFLFVIIILIPIQTFSQSRICVLEIDGFISNPTADYICEKISMLNGELPTAAAELLSENQKGCIIIDFDSNGGLDEPINKITHAILKSEIPVVVFIQHKQELPLSNGLLIPLSAHIAAMRPGVKINPQNRKFDMLIDTLSLKKESYKLLEIIDTMESAQKRNVFWISKSYNEKMILDAEYAQSMKVVDLLAINLNDLLQKLDGRRVSTNKGSKALQTARASIEEMDMEIWLRTLGIFCDPAVGYVIFILGFYCLLWAIFNKQKLFFISTATVLFAASYYIFSTLPINYIGLSLIILSFIIMTIGVKITSYGVFQIIGTVLLFAGSVLLIDIYKSLLIFYIPLYLILAISGISFIVFITTRA